MKDLELLEAWRRGDQQAGNLLFRRHASSIYRFFRSKVGSTAVAEDLAQKSFLGCVEGRDRMRGEASFRTYLFAVARNQLLMYLRTKGGVKERFSPSAHSVVDSGLAAVPGRAARLEERRLIMAAMQHIPVDFQIALELFYWEDMAVAEIADVLQLPIGTVKSRLARARDHLRAQLGKMVAPEELLQSTMGDLEKWARLARDSPPEETRS